MLPAAFAIPELDTLDNAAITGQIDGTGAPARRDAVTNDQFFILAVAVVYNHAFEENFAAADAQLNGAEPPVVMPDVNIVVILAASTCASPR